MKTLVDDKAKFANWSACDDIKNQLNLDLTMDNKNRGTFPARGTSKQREAIPERFDGRPCHMKKIWMPVLLLVLCLTACGTPDAPPAEEVTPPAETSAPEAPAENPTGTDTPENLTGTGIPEDVHTLSEGGNVVEHEEALYCGNTVTSVTKEKWAGGETWTVDFWGSDSVALTDLLRFLDYSGDVCRCLPEYTVDTEFGGGYGVNLSEGYARYDGGQTDLTEEQLELIRGIIERQSETAEN